MLYQKCFQNQFVCFYTCNSYTRHRAAFEIDSIVVRIAKIQCYFRAKVGSFRPFTKKKPKLALPVKKNVTLSRTKMVNHKIMYDINNIKGSPKKASI